MSNTSKTPASPPPPYAIAITSDTSPLLTSAPVKRYNQKDPKDIFTRKVEANFGSNGKPRTLQTLTETSFNFLNKQQNFNPKETFSTQSEFFESWASNVQRILDPLLNQVFIENPEYSHSPDDLNEKRKLIADLFIQSLKELSPPLDPSNANQFLATHGTPQLSLEELEVQAELRDRRVMLSVLYIILSILTLAAGGYVISNSQN